MIGVELFIADLRWIFDRLFRILMIHVRDSWYINERMILLRLWYKWEDDINEGINSFQSLTFTYSSRSAKINWRHIYWNFSLFWSVVFLKRPGLLWYRYRYLVCRITSYDEFSDQQLAASHAMDGLGFVVGNEIVIIEYDRVIEWMHKCIKQKRTRWVKNSSAGSFLTRFISSSNMCFKAFSVSCMLSANRSVPRTVRVASHAVTMHPSPFRINRKKRKIHPLQGVLLDLLNFLSAGRILSRPSKHGQLKREVSWESCTFTGCVVLDHLLL